MKTLCGIFGLLNLLCGILALLILVPMKDCAIFIMIGCLLALIYIIIDEKQ